MATALEKGGFDAILPQGAYYMLGGSSKNYPGKSGQEVLDIMIDTAGVAAIPSHEFYPGELSEMGEPFLRFCFSVPDEMLVETGERLERLGEL